LHTCSVFGEFILGESETKPIKPINHEQPTNWRLSISTPRVICHLPHDPDGKLLHMGNGATSLVMQAQQLPNAHQLKRQVFEQVICMRVQERKGWLAVATTRRSGKRRRAVRPATACVRPSRASGLAEQVSSPAITRTPLTACDCSAPCTTPSTRASGCTITPPRAGATTTRRRVTSPAAPSGDCVTLLTLLSAASAARLAMYLLAGVRARGRGLRAGADAGQRLELLEPLAQRHARAPRRCGWSRGLPLHRRTHVARALRRRRGPEAAELHRTRDCSARTSENIMLLRRPLARLEQKTTGPRQQGAGDMRTWSWGASASVFANHFVTL